MEFVYAALMLHSAKKEVNESNLKKVAEAAGIASDDAKLKALVASLEGVNIDDAIKQSVAFAAPAAGPSPAAGAAPAKEEKKEEKKTEEEAAGGLAALFG
ncbi:50S ribosomal protein P1 [Candidatus Micrarchaeota archaeon]|nr:50S ribosomal protein P1 [Candidatus Micrarchaeota archaeon]